MTNFEIGIGIDLGSSAVRVGIYDTKTDGLLRVISRKVSYTNWGSGKVTQSSEEIMSAIGHCFKTLKVDIRHVKSCGVAATCSMAVFERHHGQGLLPIDVYGYCTSTPHNVVFWMDNFAREECNALNKQDIQEKHFMGGSFIPEMAIPKLMNIAARYSDNLEINLEVFDLHTYIAYAIATSFSWDARALVNVSTTNGIGHDGELRGWKPSFYSEVVCLPNNIFIGPLSIPEPAYPTKVVSCIDCYSGWFSIFPSSPEYSLFIAAGTSTCYLYATKNSTKCIPGVWGPFTDIIDDTNHSSWQIYEAGQSATGLLIEHLFQSHPAAIAFGGSRAELFEKIERIIMEEEEKSGKSIHFQAKHKFMYGELQGNRTPYCNPSMSGVFIGETTDRSFFDLTLKYISALEFLAFQTKQIIDSFENNIKELRVVGSQADNARLLSLISLVNNQMPIKVPLENASLMGVRGAYLMGKAKAEGKPIFEVIECRDRLSKIVKDATVIKIDDEKSLKKLLNVKYEIFLDMAKVQQKYISMVNTLNY